MVAKSPRFRLRETAAPPPLSPTLLRDTVRKVDMCVARLQELQHTAVGGRKGINGNSTTGGRCKEEGYIRIKNGIGHRSSSPPGKLPPNAVEWRRMSLPAMLVGETMREIIERSRFTRNVVEAMSKKHAPTTPPTERRNKAMMQHSELHSRRKREKQTTRSSQPDAQRPKSRIIFDSCSPHYIANTVTPRNRPWAKKTVMFPNPLFQYSPKSINRAIPNKLLIKSPPPKLQIKIRRSEPHCFLVKKSPTPRRSFSPSGLAMRLVSPVTKSVPRMGR